MKGEMSILFLKLDNQKSTSAACCFFLRKHAQRGVLMIYITGDTHGDWMSRLNTNAFPEQKSMTKQDYVIICGDFGIWNDTKKEKYNLDWLEDRSFTTLFVDGNHENFDRLYSMSVAKWRGGKVHFIRPSVIHLMRGQIFHIEGRAFWTFGGAGSHDIQDGILEKDDPRIKKWKHDYEKMFRVNHVSWWRDELPSQEEMEEGRKNLANTDNRVDFIVTHCGATSSTLLYSLGEYKPDVLTDYLEEIRQKAVFKKWFMGHYHDNYAINDKEIIIYEQIVRIA